MQCCRLHEQYNSFKFIIIIFTNEAGVYTKLSLTTTKKLKFQPTDMFVNQTKCHHLC